MIGRCRLKLEAEAEIDIFSSSEVIEDEGTNDRGVEDETGGNETSPVTGAKTF